MSSATNFSIYHTGTNLPCLFSPEATNVTYILQRTMSLGKFFFLPKKIWNQTTDSIILSISQIGPSKSDYHDTTVSDHSQFEISRRERQLYNNIGYKHRKTCSRSLLGNVSKTRQKRLLTKILLKITSEWNVLNGKLPFIWFTKKDTLMLLNWWWLSITWSNQFKAFSINLNGINGPWNYLLYC